MAWYDQSKFPQLFYLKLKGTQIRPDLSRLKWTSKCSVSLLVCGSLPPHHLLVMPSTAASAAFHKSLECVDAGPRVSKPCKPCTLPSLFMPADLLYSPAPSDAGTCNAINWGKKDGSAGSAGEWVQNCSPGGSPNCDTCDWWPSRSSAAWYYDAAAASPTCSHYFVNGTQYPCDSKLGYYTNSSATNTPNPSSSTCCYFQPTCGLTAVGGSSYKCTQPGMVFNETSLASYPPSSTACCRPFVPTCGAADISGTPYQCPSDGITYDLVNSTSSNPSVAACCSFVPTCEAIDTSKTDYTCTTANFVLDPNSYKARGPSNETCCTKSNCAPSASGFFPGVYYNYTGSAYCYYATCGAVLELDQNSLAVVNVTAFECPTGYTNNTNAKNSTDVSVASCCFRPTCGAVDTSGTPYTCPATYSLISNHQSQTVVSNASIDTATCCYQPTCGVYTYSGSPYQCPGGGYVFLDSAYAVSNPDASTCCVSRVVAIAVSGTAAG